MKVIIVGGVAVGASAAARIRRLNETAEITVFERSGYISYANCGLPYYIGDVIEDEEESLETEAISAEDVELLFTRIEQIRDKYGEE